jgi:DNA-binding LytR/AlgR family response regulator
MKVLIIEDEVLAAQRLKQMLQAEIPGIIVDGPLDTVKASIRHLSEHNEYELIFLDIQLADGKSFSIFENISLNNPVIFTTAYDEYAIKAFELNSLDYLLKPIQSSKLSQALAKFRKLKETFGREDQMSLLNEILLKVKNEQSIYQSRFLVNKGDSLIPVPVEDVAYFYAEDKVVILMCKDATKYIINYSLEDLEQKTDPTRFFRINRQFLVSVSSIKKVHYYFNYKLKLELLPACEHDAIVSRQKTSDFKAWMSR